ncbi:unnamed protein product [Cuscuta europaea]|uniref:Uncharacterized protein n=1 Tax=Cuscuta europaea TaxID=41803 RepID=A0A9P1E5B9_CUSEU|nr:unnamed protein product [Cuscuta europaea]
MASEISSTHHIGQPSSSDIEVSPVSTAAVTARFSTGAISSMMMQPASSSVVHSTAEPFSSSWTVPSTYSLFNNLPPQVPWQSAPVQTPPSLWQQVLPQSSPVQVQSSQAPWPVVPPTIPCPPPPPQVVHWKKPEPPVVKLNWAIFRQTGRSAAGFLLRDHAGAMVAADGFPLSGSSGRHEAGGSDMTEMELEGFRQILDRVKSLNYPQANAAASVVAKLGWTEEFTWRVRDPMPRKLSGAISLDAKSVPHIVI